MKVGRPRGLLLVSVTAAVMVGSAQFAVPTAAADTATNPIDHIVVLYMENHSFNDVLGKLCVIDSRCVGTETGQLSNGTVIPLAQGQDVVPLVGHGTKAIVTAINGGAMNGYSRILHCGATDNYACYSQYDPSQIPNLAALARQFAISDMTFNSSPYSSWESHIALVSATEDGFVGNLPHPSAFHAPAQGWGCDSFLDAAWRSSPTSKPILVPSCIPAQGGSGPYRTSPVPWVPTIMDRMDQAGLTWKIDGGGGPLDTSVASGYVWTTCPSFADCLYTSQVNNFVPAASILDQAATGTLPNLALVTPKPQNTQHNGASMLAGDNWIGKVVGALMTGPEWSSTAILITYDDCGCFYDGVAPPSGYGIRSPMVIVSPYAKAGFTDSNIASTYSILALIEHTFGLTPLGAGDAAAYDYSESFDLAQTPRRPLAMARTSLPAGERHWLSAHPVHVGGT